MSNYLPMNVRVSHLIFFFLTVPFFLNAQTLRGFLHNADVGTPVSGATVHLQLERDSQGVQVTQSGPEGDFIFESLRPGFYRLEAEAPGYSRLQVRQILISAGKEMVLDLAIQAVPAELPGVQITADAPGRRSFQSISEIPLTREQNLRYPATFFDPARLALAYPGLANADDQANGLSIRGNGPGALRWRLEGVDVVNPNHLSNAGTFNDLPTAASGGVLLFSAQLLDNSALLTGAFPAGYGDALGGVMDINLRKGNQQQREFTVQAGLIGIDIASEGPIQKGRSSYLANYRYSTVGLLGDMGVSFGGETINFQDLSVKLDFTGKKGGQWSFFGMGGLNETIFEPPTDSADVGRYKDLFNIRFDGRTGIAGVRYWNSLGAKTWLRATAVLSAREDERSSTGLGLEDIDNSAEARLGIGITLSHRLSEQHRLLAGWYQQSINYQLESLRNGQAGALGGQANFLQLQPWAQWEWTDKAGKTFVRAGLHSFAMNINTDSLISSDQNLEPRLQVTRRLNSKHQIAWSGGLHSQMLPLWLYTSRLPQSNGNLFWNRALGLTRSVQTGLRHTWSLGGDWVLRSELSYQWLYDVPVTAMQATAFSMLNVSEIVAPDSLFAIGNGENKSMELSLERYFDGNWFLMLNGTLLQARYRGSDDVWRDSRWNLRQVLNLTTGKEWIREKRAGRVRAFGVNTRLTAHGGFRTMPVDAAASALARTTVFDSSEGFSAQLPAFFRMDARIYWRRNFGNRRNSTLAMEFQNITMQQNTAYYYYDPYTQQVETKYQLGLIPNVSWKVEF
jgi:hypothetical protein